MLRSIPTFVSRVVCEFVSRMMNDFSCVEGGDWDNVSVSAGCCGHHLSDNMSTSEWLSLYGTKRVLKVKGAQSHESLRDASSRRNFLTIPPIRQEPQGVDGRGKVQTRERDKILIVDMPLLDAQTLQVTRRAKNE